MIIPEIISLNKNTDSVYSQNYCQLFNNDTTKNDECITHTNKLVSGYSMSIESDYRCVITDPRGIKVVYSTMMDFLRTFDNNTVKIVDNKIMGYYCWAYCSDIGAIILVDSFKLEEHQRKIQYENDKKSRFLAKNAHAKKLFKECEPGCIIKLSNSDSKSVYLGEFYEVKLKCYNRSMKKLKTVKKYVLDVDTVKRNLTDPRFILSAGNQFNIGAIQKTYLEEEKIDVDFSNILYFDESQPLQNSRSNNLNIVDGRYTKFINVYKEDKDILLNNNPVFKFHKLDESQSIEYFINTVSIYMLNKLNHGYKYIHNVFFRNPDPTSFTKLDFSLTGFTEPHLRQSGEINDQNYEDYLGRIKFRASYLATINTTNNTYSRWGSYFINRSFNENMLENLYVGYVEIGDKKYLI